MEEDSPIKEILYDVIREIPEKEIQTLFENGNHSKLIENLFEKTRAKRSKIVKICSKILLNAFG